MKFMESSWSTAEHDSTLFVVLTTGKNDLSHKSRNETINNITSEY